MKIHRQAAEAVAKERAANRIVLAKGWYPVKIIEAEEKQGKGEGNQSEQLVVSARVKYRGADGQDHKVKQKWSINFTKRDGEPNLYGHETINSLIDACGVQVPDTPDVELPDPDDLFSGKVVSAYLAVEAARDYKNSEGKVVTQPERNQAKEFRAVESTAGAPPAPTAGAPVQAPVQAEPDPIPPVDEAGFDDDIPF